MSSTSLIREASEADLPRILEMGERSIAEGPYHDTLTFNREQASATARQVIQSPMGKILLAVAGEAIIGLMAFLVVPQMFSGEAAAHELMWYIEPEHRVGFHALALVRRAERDARTLGAKSIILTAPTEQVERMYGMLKYSKLETTYRKVL